MTDIPNKLTHNKYLNSIVGNITPLKDKVLVKNLDKGEQKTKHGIIILDDDGSEAGVRPRWAEIWKVGKDIKDVKPGEWILISHGRWSRTFIVHEDNNKFDANLIDYPDSILLITDSNPL